MSAVFSTLSLAFGIASSFYHDTILLGIIFRIVLLAGVACFTWARNIFAGFDTSEIMKLSMGEKKQGTSSLLLFQSYHLCCC
jgi:hypothetical protein